MPISDQSADIILQPGDWHFGDRSTHIRTVLGTCVSLVLWHPTRRTGYRDVMFDVNDGRMHVRQIRSTRSQCNRWREELPCAA